MFKLSKAKTIAAGFAALLTACTQIGVQPTPIEVASDKPVALVAATVKPVVLPYMKPEWTKELLTDLKAELPNLNQAADMKTYCPKYSNLSADKQVLVWGRFVAAVLKYESGIKNGFIDSCSSMTESTGQDSIGLFQLSYGDKFCPATKAKGNLCDPIVNIKCGVKLMGYFVSRDKVVALGGYTSYGAPQARGIASYWSVTRVPDRKSSHHLSEITIATKATAGCL